MRAIVNGVLYDTDEAELIGVRENDEPEGSSLYIREELYLREDGQYFLAGKGGCLTEYREKITGGFQEGTKISPLGDQNIARMWAEHCLDVETVLEHFEIET